VPNYLKTDTKKGILSSKVPHFTS